MRSATDTSLYKYALSPAPAARAPNADPTSPVPAARRSIPCGGPGGAGPPPTCPRRGNRLRQQNSEFSPAASVQSAAGDKARPGWGEEWAPTAIGVATASRGRSTRPGRTFGWVARGGTASRQHGIMAAQHPPAALPARQGLAEQSAGLASIPAAGKGRGSALARAGSRWQGTAGDGCGWGRRRAQTRPGTGWHRGEEDLLFPSFAAGFGGLRWRLGSREEAGEPGPVTAQECLLPPGRAPEKGLEPDRIPVWRSNTQPRAGNTAPGGDFTGNHREGAWKQEGRRIGDKNRLVIVRGARLVLRRTPARAAPSPGGPAAGRGESPGVSCRGVSCRRSRTPPGIALPAAPGMAGGQLRSPAPAAQ